MAQRRQLRSLSFSAHAIRQMFARKIPVEDVRTVVNEGDTIAQYPDDRPYPSELILEAVGGRPLHVVLAYNQADSSGYVITAYIPDPKLWSNDFRRRRRR